jgi:purine-binding chemotaxis protein CheW
MTDTDDRKRILKARAQALAREPAATVTEAAVEIVEFLLATQRYGLETGWVDEVFPFKELTPVPCTPACFVGVVNVRGRMLAVLDLRRFLGLPSSGLRDLHTVIILRSEEQDLGILADDVAGVRSVPLSQLQEARTAPGGIALQYLRGVTATGVVVLDVGKLLADPALTVNEEVV